MFKVTKLAEHPPEALVLTSIRKASEDPTKKDFVVVIKNATNPCKVKSMEVSFPIKMKTEGALSLKIQCDLSDEQYQIIRNSCIMQNIHPYFMKLRMENRKVTLRV